MEDKGNQGNMELAVMEVCPTEDAVTALMDYFVQPLLPAKSTKQHTPTPAQQEAVAKQVHAVAILYNYFHRKRHPQLEFLDLISFCELMTILKPQMLGYMKFMQLAACKESEDVEKCMSLTEKCIMDACCICKQLDVVQGLPTLETLPVCKVAVMLVDAERKNCCLQFGSITEGAWSLIEKEVDATTLAVHDCENPGQPKGVYIRKRAARKPTRYGDSLFLKIAMSAITEATDINQANLKVLESHHVYSLNKENAAVRFFIVKCTKSFSFSEKMTVVPVEIECVINSLQGPLVKRDCISWSVTDAVEYFHLLPYATIVSEWLSRGETSDEFQNKVLVSGVLDADEPHMAIEPSKAPAANDSDGPTSASSLAVLFDAKLNTNNVCQKESRGSCKSSTPDTTTISKNMDHNGFLESTEEKRLVPDIHAAKQLQVGSTFCAPREKNGNSSQGNIKVKDETVETKFDKNSSDLKVVTENTCNNGVVEYDNHRPLIDSTAVSQPSEPRHVLHAIASSGNLLSQSALKVVLKKREKLVRQRREIEDEIAQCDKAIQLILSGREDNLAITLESLMEACNDMNLISPAGSRSVALAKYDDHASVEHKPPKRKRASDVTPHQKNPCKSDYSNRNSTRCAMQTTGLYHILVFPKAQVDSKA
ncbi:hypothetical protein QQ045_003472 [Rhodiola kirilowii]